MTMKHKLMNIKDMPGYNPITNTTNRPENDVSTRKVYWHYKSKVTCKEHKAMLCVNEDRTLWRCPALGCNVGAFVEWSGWY